MGKYRVLTGDITDDIVLSGHDLIINPTNPQMIAGSGVSGAIFKKAGVDILEEYTQREYNINYFSDDYRYEKIMKIGDVRITPGFNLNMDIMFVQGPKKWEHENAFELLIDTYNNMLKEIENKRYKNILIPSLGTGHYGFTHEEVGSVVKKMMNDFVKDKDINIDLVLYNDRDKEYYI